MKQTTTNTHTVAQTDPNVIDNYCCACTLAKRKKESAAGHVESQAPPARVPTRTKMRLYILRDSEKGAHRSQVTKTERCVRLIVLSHRSSLHEKSFLQQPLVGFDQSPLLSRSVLHPPPFPAAQSPQARQKQTAACSFRRSLCAALSLLFALEHAINTESTSGPLRRLPTHASTRETLPPE